MTEYIDKDKLLDELRESAEHHAENSREEQLMLRDRNIVRAQSAADVALVIHGSWIDLSNGECDDFGRPYVYVKCSECGETAIEYSDYCPHCGAKMDKEGCE